MKRNILCGVILIAFVLVENSFGYDFDLNTVCLVIKNGSYVRHPSSCATWIQCYDEEPIIGSCVGDMLFDHVTERCVEKSKANCKFNDPKTVCDSEFTHNTFVNDPKSCDGYYYCFNGVGTLGNCPLNQQFNPDTKMCDYSYKCEQMLYNVCDFIDDRKLFANPNECSDYHFCLNGALRNGKCPDGLYFDKYTGDCNEPSKVNCKFNDDIEEIAPPKPDFQRNTTCGTKGNPINAQFVSDGISCNGYFQCKSIENEVDLNPTYHLCDNKQYFNPITQECDHRINVKCEFDRCVGMGSNKANKNNDDCRGYLICENDEFVTYMQCPANQYFNEISQTCSENHISYPACAA